ncbi:hypothetical protein BGZ65_001574 [Modicella reniformis]|uniref:Autophagy-related protein 27 n=1 Tax=Modicella reniformis TaxID=1440133 RepID=A0A9P6MBQ1_9FUNG|nr:hypothetical protein BGZ65_001574 [Modicella reniformis]
MTRINPRLTLAILALLTVSSVANAQTDASPPYNCENISVDGNSYNISVLKSMTFKVDGVPKEDHPSKIRVDYQLNPCQAIVIPDGETKIYCKADTWVCQDTKLVQEEGGDPKTLFLRTIAGSAPATDSTPAREVAPSVARAEKIANVEDLPWNLTLKGGNIDGQDQSAIITFICDKTITDEKAGPSLTKYDKGVVYFSWKTTHACPIQVELPKADGMSGFGLFLRIVAIIAAFYLIAGMAYNHYFYGAKGLDLIPHIGNDHDRIELRQL